MLILVAGSTPVAHPGMAATAVFFLWAAGLGPLFFANRANVPGEWLLYDRFISISRLRFVLDNALDAGETLFCHDELRIN